MYYKLYIDVLFLENLLLDYLLLGLLSALLRCSTTRLRRGLAAALGSVGVCLLYLFSLNGTLVGSLFLYVGLSTAMVRLGLSIRGGRPLVRSVALLYVCSLLLGGIFQWLQTRIRVPVYSFLFFSMASFGLLTLCMRGLMQVRLRRQTLYRVILTFRGKNLELKGLLDTGNQLRDPLLGGPVSLMTKETVKELAGDEEIRFHPVPYHSVGRARGLLPVFAADSMEIYLSGGEQRHIEKPLLGVPDEPLSSEKEYQLILHPELLG